MSVTVTAGTATRWGFSHSTAGVNAPAWLTFEVHRPYFDGAETPLTAIQARGPILAARRYEQRAPAALRFGMTMPASYRLLLTEESRLRAYRALSPADLPDELASPAWRRMSQAYAGRAGLDLADRAGLAHWLVAVCLPAAVLEVIDADLPAADCRDPAAASLQFARATALFGLEGLTDRTVAAYRSLTDDPAPTTVHVRALAGWGYLVARHAGDASAAPALLDAARAMLGRIAPGLSGFEHAQHEFRLALRSAMHAGREGDLTGARQHLDAAGQALAGLSPDGQDEELLLLEARRQLLDRLVEIAARQGDTDTERAAIAECLALDPTCVKIRMQAAQERERAADHERALAGYLHAARLGPFGTAFALLRAAACARELGHAEFGRVLTERAFRAAPRSAATADALAQACRQDGDEPLEQVTRLAARRDTGRRYANNWHYQMYAAYFNLGESQSPVLYARLPTLAFEAAQRGELRLLNWQRLLPPAFRRNLIAESGLAEFGVSHPAELPDRLRTPAWDTLCEWVAQLPDFGPERQHQVAAVLFRIGFGKLVPGLVPAVPADQLRTEAEMRLQHWRDLVRYVNSIGGRVVTPAASFAIGQRPACPPLLRLEIAVFAAVFHARQTRSVQEASAWRDIALSSLAEVLDSPEYSEFQKVMLESRCYRSVCYVPFLQGDRARLGAEMARCEELARAAPAGTEYEAFLKRENLRACLETRSKECYAFGEAEAGHRLVAEVLAVDPYEPKSHIEVAQGLLMRQQPRQAADSFLRTARLGPVSTTEGYAGAAETLAAAGEPVLAEDCYLQVLRLDPYAISAARGWAAVAAEDGMAELAREYLSELEAWGAARMAARAASTDPAASAAPSPAAAGAPSPA